MRLLTNSYIFNSSVVRCTWPVAGWSTTSFEVILTVTLLKLWTTSKLVILKNVRLLGQLLCRRQVTCMLFCEGLIDHINTFADNLQKYTVIMWTIYCHCEGVGKNLIKWMKTLLSFFATADVIYTYILLKVKLSPKNKIRF